MVTRSDSGFGAGAMVMGLIVLILLVVVLLFWVGPLRTGGTDTGSGAGTGSGSGTGSGTGGDTIPGNTVPNPASSPRSWVPSGPGLGHVLVQSS